MSTRTNKKARQPGIWLAKDGRGVEATFVYLGGRPHTYPPDAWASGVFGMYRSKDAAGSEIMVSDSVGLSIIRRGRDITEEYLNDEDNVIFMTAFAPHWIEIILHARPEIMVSKEVIKKWMKSSDKEVRLLAAKYAHRLKGSVKR